MTNSSHEVESFSPLPKISPLLPSSNLGLTNITTGEGNGTPLQYSCLENPMDRGALWAAVHGVAKSRTGLSDFTFTFHFHALEKEMAPHSRVLAWRAPGTGEPGVLPSMGSPKVRHNWSDLAAATLPCPPQGESYCTHIVQFSSVQFSSVAQSCPTLWDPMNPYSRGILMTHPYFSSSMSQKNSMIWVY